MVAACERTASDDMAQKRVFPGRVMQCPSCRHEVACTWLSGMAEPLVHFYANDNNDVLVRTAWFEPIEARFQQGTPDSSVLAAINCLLKVLPSAPSKYAVWNYVKCPSCRREFPYWFKGNLKLRLQDPEVILLDGCKLDNDGDVFVVGVDLMR
jgi:hypothetical protein